MFQKVLFSAAILGSAAFMAAPAKAQDASWGCQVLLCAASSNPSWHGVPYCVPPMTKLISAMAKPGFSWPICQEAKAGKPGREIYEACPEGTKIGYSESDHDGMRREPDQCVKTVNICKDRRNGKSASYGYTYRSRVGGHDSGESCIQEVSTPRPRRANPWFFDIPNKQGVKERFWFNLRT